MLKVYKTVIGNLNKCYSLTKLNWKNNTYFVCAAEKNDPAYLYDENFNFIEKLWDSPGGVMSMEQYPGKNLTILATNQFYSPNDSSDACIVYYQKVNSIWERRVLCDLPFVHRFGILEQNGKRYIVACTIKSSHAYKNDWSCPGRVWVSELYDDLNMYNDDHPLELTPLISGLYKNHGFYIVKENSASFALVGTENGIYKIVPPEKKDADWKYEKILNVSASDMLIDDFDNDGKKEIVVISPFHGDSLVVYHSTENGYEWVFRYSEKLPFLHAICSGEINGTKYCFIGNREGKQNILAIHFDPKKRQYITQIIDENAGSANVLFYDGKVISANRETNEIVVYTLEEVE